MSCGRDGRGDAGAALPGISARCAKLYADLRHGAVSRQPRSPNKVREAGAVRDDDVTSTSRPQLSTIDSLPVRRVISYVCAIFSAFVAALPGQYRPAEQDAQPH